MEKQSEIKHLGFPDSVRINPQMLLGSLNDSSLLFRELLDNARDELIASEHCNKIWLKCDSDFHIVADNGRGINIALSEDDLLHRTQLEMAVASLYSGGKYDRDVISSGQHGIGSSAVNAVSDTFKVACKITSDNWRISNPFVKSQMENKSDKREGSHTGYYYALEYHKGVKSNEYVVNEEGLKSFFNEDKLPEGMSTIVGFTSDPTIVHSNKVDFKREWIEYTEFILKKFYNKDIEVYLNYEKQDLSLQTYKYEFIDHTILKHPDWGEINKSIDWYVTFEFDKDLSVSAEDGCVNMVSVNRGVHINWIKSRIADCLIDKYNIKHHFVYQGLKLRVILLAKKVGYDSQTKTRLVNVECLSSDDFANIDKKILKIYDEHNDEIKAHVEALNELAASYQSISAKSYIEQMVNVSTSNNRSKSYQPVKLIDASAPANERDKCELFIGEGNSAIGTIMKVRDPYYHACMPMKGVSLNTSWMSLESAFQNVEVKDIISAVGTGAVDPTDPNGGYYDMNALRYGKIILAADSDGDGFHIDALLLGIFAAFMPFLIEEGKLFVLESPFYKQDGKFLYPSEADELDKNKPFDRFKGLGSLNATSQSARQEIIDIFINPQTRHLIQVTPDGIDLAKMTLGDKDTRRVLMQKANLIYKDREYYNG